MSIWRTTGICLAMLAGSSAPAAAGAVPLTGGQFAQIKVRSMVDLRFKNIIRQEKDISCGAAALATLFSFYYGDKVKEEEIIKAIYAFGDKEKIQKDGFSMLELKKFGETKNYVAQGFRIPDVKNLAKLRVPVITLINTRGYNHFVVIKGVKDGMVYIADPAFGNISRPLKEFAKGWKNVILVFLSRQRNGDNKFVLDPMLKAPIQDIRYLIDQSLGTIRPGVGEF
jgi:uncharacterized protein